MDWEKHPRSEWQLLEALQEKAHSPFQPRGPTELLNLQKMAASGLVTQVENAEWMVTEAGLAHLLEAPPALLWSGALQDQRSAGTADDTTKS